MLGRVLAMEWVYGVNLLEAAIGVTGNLSAYVGRGYPASTYWASLLTCDYSTYIIQSDINISSMSETAP